MCLEIYPLRYCAPDSLPVLSNICHAVAVSPTANFKWGAVQRLFGAPTYPPATLDFGGCPAPSAFGAYPIGSFYMNLYFGNWGAGGNPTACPALNQAGYGILRSLSPTSRLPLPLPPPSPLSPPSPHPTS